MKCSEKLTDPHESHAASFQADHGVTGLSETWLEVICRLLIYKENVSIGLAQIYRKRHRLIHQLMLEEDTVAQCLNELSFAFPTQKTHKLGSLPNTGYISLEEKKRI